MSRNRNRPTRKEASHPSHDPLSAGRPDPRLGRRDVLLRGGYGVAGAALASLLGGESSAHAKLASLPHFAPKAKRVICLFMSGGMSQLDSFDCKPVLKKRELEPLPASVFNGRKPLGMSKLQASFPMQGTAFDLNNTARAARGSATAFRIWPGRPTRFASSRAWCPRR